jgi:hypothetical protein
VSTDVRKLSTVTGQDHQPRTGDDSFQGDGGIDRSLVFITDQDEQRHRKPAQPFCEVEEGGPLLLEAPHRERRADVGVLSQHRGEFGVSERILVLELDAGRADCITGGHRG